MVCGIHIELAVESRADPIHLVETMMAKCLYYFLLHYRVRTLFHLPG